MTTLLTIDFNSLWKIHGRNTYFFVPREKKIFVTLQVQTVYNIKSLNLFVKYTNLAIRSMPVLYTSIQDQDFTSVDTKNMNQRRLHPTTVT